MARLAQLRLAMSVSVLLVAIIFSAFLAALVLIVRAYLVPFSTSFALLIIGAGTLIFILIEYLIGPAIVRASTRLRYLKPGEHPWLESTVKDIAQKSEIPMPKLAIVPDETPNAFVFGRTRGGVTLAVHEGLLKQLDKEEIRGVVGHELGHIKHRDFIVMTLLSAIPLLAFMIARVSFEVAVHATDGGKEKKEGGIPIRAALFAAAIISYVVYFVSLLCVMRLSRLREHYADAYSAYVTGEPRQLESALTKISYGLSLAPQPPHGARTLYIGDQALAKQECQGILHRKEEYDLDKDGVLDERELELAMEREAKSRWKTINTWFATHPATYQRIILLREIGSEMASGRYSSERIYAYI